MASQKSKQYPHKWPDGTYHSIPYTQHQQNMAVGTRQPWSPPPGTYDIGLDAQERTARKGYGETMEDIGRGSERLGSDFGVGQGDIERQRADVQRQYGESLTDLITQRTQGQEDYQTNLQTLARNYQRLGNTQQQAARQHGLYGGGALQQGAEKRAVNQALEKAPIDTAFNRFMQGSQLSEQRLGEAQLRGTGEVDRSAGRLGTTYERGIQDYTTQGRRAGTSLSDFIQDVAAAKQAQYKQYTGLPIPKPKKAKKK